MGRVGSVRSCFKARLLSSVDFLVSKFMHRRWLFGALSLVLALLVGAVLYYWNEVREARADTPALIKQAFQKFGHTVTATDMPPSRLNLLLKIEDPTFRIHHGVDLATPGAGMTTITQGLVKLLYFPDGFRPGIAKIRQTLIAEYALNSLVSKDVQLDLYLNATYFVTVDGSPVHGACCRCRGVF